MAGRSIVLLVVFSCTISGSYMQCPTIEDEESNTNIVDIAGGCYLFRDVPEPCGTSSVWCKSHSGYIAVINDEDEEQAIFNYTSYYAQSCAYWTGYRESNNGDCDATKVNLVWHTGNDSNLSFEEIHYCNVSEDEPKGGGDTCMSLIHISDAWCWQQAAPYNLYGCICEFDPHTIPINTETYTSPTPASVTTPLYMVTSVTGDTSTITVVLSENDTGNFIWAVVSTSIAIVLLVLCALFLTIILCRRRKIRNKQEVDESFHMQENNMYESSSEPLPVDYEDIDHIRRNMTSTFRESYPREEGIPANNDNNANGLTKGIAPSLPQRNSVIVSQSDNKVPTNNAKYETIDIDTTRPQMMSKNDNGTSANTHYETPIDGSHNSLANGNISQSSVDPKMNDRRRDKINSIYESPIDVLYDDADVPANDVVDPIGQCNTRLYDDPVDMTEEQHSIDGLHVSDQTRGTGRTVYETPSDASVLYSKPYKGVSAAQSQSIA